MTDRGITRFADQISQCIQQGSFAQLTMGNYQGADADLKKIIVKQAIIKREQKLSFTYRLKTRDIVKNHDIDAGVAEIIQHLENGFKSATLMTISEDVILEEKKDGWSVRTAKPSITEMPDMSHDKEKKRAIPENAGYLHHLGVTDETGRVYKNAQDKFRQINKYIELLAPLLKDMRADKIRVADMGSGKGYLTFALYDYLTNTLQKTSDVTGVEYRADMVALCNDIVAKVGFSGLNFVEGSIEEFNADGFNVMIALHACDTATDDAIAKGIQTGAELIVVAPCCHKQIRREMEKARPRAENADLLRHGIFLERQAEMVTDGLRALILERMGYKVKVFEFISGEHTPKNVMITAIKSGVEDPKIDARIAALKAFYNIGTHHLEGRLGI